MAKALSSLTKANENILACRGCPDQGPDEISDEMKRRMLELCDDLKAILALKQGTAVAVGSGRADMRCKLHAH
eukprot:6852444-Pyramimonas_sp.AAC.1